MTKQDHESQQTKESKKSRRTILKTGIATGFTVLGSALKSSPVFAAVRDQEVPENVQWLFVQSAKDVTLKQGKLTLKEVSPTTLFFSDRPKRLAGHMTTEEFLLDWDEGKDNFHVDPPNANLSVFGGEEIVDVIMTLKNPRMEGKNLTYEVVILYEEDHPMTAGPCSLFIDPLGGLPRRHRRRRRRRVRRHAVIH